MMRNMVDKLSKQLGSSKPSILVLAVCAMLAGGLGAAAATKHTDSCMNLGACRGRVVLQSKVDKLTKQLEDQQTQHAAEMTDMRQVHEAKEAELQQQVQAATANMV